jgi:hypothetical protein
LGFCERKLAITRNIRPDDETIQEISSQIRDQSWENIVFGSPDADEILRWLNWTGVNVSVSKIKMLTSKFGKTDLINAIN